MRAGRPPKRRSGNPPRQQAGRAPIPASDVVRRRMQTTPRRDTVPELRLRRALHAHGLRFRVDRRVDEGTMRRADVVLAKARVVVFLDGCFWHGCPRHVTWPTNNADWWREKIEANRKRDRSTTRRLRSAGWVVIRVWEHADIERAALRVVEAVRAILNARENVEATRPRRPVRPTRSPSSSGGRRAVGPRRSAPRT